MNVLHSDMGSFFCLVSAGVNHAATERPTPDHSNSINHNMIQFNILFDSIKDTLPSCFMNRLIGVFLLHVLNSLPFVVLLYSPVPAKIASN